MTETYPNSKWGYGKLDIFAAMSSVPVVDGYMSDPAYSNLAYFSSGRNGFGDDNDLKTIKYYADGTNIYLGITGEITSNDHILIFFNFSGYVGRGSNTLGNSSSDAGVFKYLGGAKMDFDVDFALALNEGVSSTNFYIDACRYGSGTPVLAHGYIGNVGSQLGASNSFDVSAVFGGTGNLTMAYHNGFAADTLRGVELSIPISAFAGVDNTNNLQLFVIITNNTGFFSNECIPGDPGASNPDTNPDFSALTGGPFHTGSSALPVELSTFYASVKGRDVFLNWTTITEINSKLFNIERSTDGLLWMTIGEIEAAGNSYSIRNYSFIDRNLNHGQFKYRLKIIDNDGSFKYSDEINVSVNLPIEYAVNQNYPNPFGTTNYLDNPSTRIEYQLPTDSKVKLELYDVLGNLIYVLIDESKSGGYHFYELNANRLGLSSGVYFYRFSAENSSKGIFTKVNKMIYIK